jgi:hypothetical protein
MTLLTLTMDIICLFIIVQSQPKDFTQMAYPEFKTRGSRIYYEVIRVSNLHIRGGVLLRDCPGFRKKLSCLVN